LHLAPQKGANLYLATSHV